jgi:hypothetical protein
MCRTTVRSVASFIVIMSTLHVGVRGSPPQAEPLPRLTNALFFFANIPPHGIVEYTITSDANGENSSTTHAPAVVVGKDAVAERGLGYANDSQCHRATFSASDGEQTI